MIPKSSRPKVDDLRPIAMTDTSYKILMSVVAQKIDKHVYESEMTQHDCMSRWDSSDSRGVEGQLTTFLCLGLGECVEDAYRRGEMLVVDWWCQLISGKHTIL